MTTHPGFEVIARIQRPAIGTRKDSEAVPTEPPHLCARFHPSGDLPKLLDCQVNGQQHNNTAYYSLPLGSSSPVKQRLRAAHSAVA